MSLLCIGTTHAKQTIYTILTKIPLLQLWMQRAATLQIENNLKKKLEKKQPPLALEQCWVQHIPHYICA